MLERRHGQRRGQGAGLLGGIYSFFEELWDWDGDGDVDVDVDIVRAGFEGGLLGGLLGLGICILIFLVGGLDDIILFVTGVVWLGMGGREEVMRTG